MKLQIVAIRDRALDAFMQPWYSPAVGAAIRAFVDEVNRPGAPANQHPEDYDLYLLGQFDEQSGTFIQEGPPVQIAIGKDHRKAGGAGGVPPGQPNLSVT